MRQSTNPLAPCSFRSIFSARFVSALAIAVSSGFACTELLSDENRTCPCVVGYQCCDNVCIPEGAASPIALATAQESSRTAGGGGSGSVSSGATTETGGGSDA